MHALFLQVDWFVAITTGGHHGPLFPTSILREGIMASVGFRYKWDVPMYNYVVAASNQILAPFPPPLSVCLCLYACTWVGLVPRPPPRFILQQWRFGLSRSRGDFLHGCEIKSGWRHGNEARVGQHECATWWDKLGQGCLEMQ